MKKNLICLDSILTFFPIVDELKDRCNSRLNIIKYLSHEKCSQKPKTLGILSKSLIESILDYSCPCLNSFSVIYLNFSIYIFDFYFNLN